MNPVASSSRILRPHSLDCGPEVLSFAEFLLGTSAGLLADLSHILIGVRLGLWDLREVESMSATGKVMALHVSSPRLTKDAHMPHIGDRSIETLRTMIDVSGIMYEIDEGRRSYHAK
jgi:hypothetical protein